MRSPFLIYMNVFDADSDISMVLFKKSMNPVREEFSIYYTYVCSKNGGSSLIRSIPYHLNSNHHFRRNIDDI